MNTLLLSSCDEDIEKAAENGVKETMIDRLTLTESRVFAIANSVRKLIALPDPLGAQRMIIITMIDYCFRIRLQK